LPPPRLPGKVQKASGALPGQNHSAIVLSQLHTGGLVAKEPLGKTTTRLSRPPATEALERGKQYGVSQEHRAAAGSFWKGLYCGYSSLYLPLPLLPVTRF